MIVLTTSTPGARRTSVDFTLTGAVGALRPLPEDRPGVAAALTPEGVRQLVAFPDPRPDPEVAW